MILLSPEVQRILKKQERKVKSNKIQSFQKGNKDPVKQIKIHQRV